MEKLKDFNFLNLIDIYPNDFNDCDYSVVSKIINKLNTLNDPQTRNQLNRETIQLIISLKIKFTYLGSMKVESLRDDIYRDFFKDVSEIFKNIMAILGYDVNDNNEVVLF